MDEVGRSSFFRWPNTMQLRDEHNSKQIDFVKMCQHEGESSDERGAGRWTWYEAITTKADGLDASLIKWSTPTSGEWCGEKNRKLQIGH